MRPFFNSSSDSAVVPVALHAAFKYANDALFGRPAERKSKRHAPATECAVSIARCPFVCTPATISCVKVQKRSALLWQNPARACPSASDFLAFGNPGVTQPDTWSNKPAVVGLLIPMFNHCLKNMGGLHIYVHGDTDATGRGSA